MIADILSAFLATLRLRGKKCGFLLFAFCFIYSINVKAQSIDLHILKTLNKNEHPAWDNVMWATSASIFVTTPGALITIAADGIAHNDPVMKRNAYKAVITLGLATAMTTTLKYSIRRKRPKAKYPEDIIERDRAGALSFPSGHTTTAFATATALSLSYNKWYVTVPSYIYAGLVGYSRMRLGMHFPLDVLGGMVIGVGAGLLTWGVDRAVNGK